MVTRRAGVAAVVLALAAVAGACTAIPGSTTTLAGVTQFDAGGTSACAVVAGGHVRCWGADDEGQLGNAALVPFIPTWSSLAVEVTGVSGATQVDVSGYLSCALISDGTIKCWGWNREGELGNGEMYDRSYTPTSVVGITNAIQVSGSCALLSSGHVKCWGYHGTLGNGSTMDSAVPVDVTGITDAVQITVGPCARLADGSVKCWGGTYWGQLGDGTNVDSLLPVPVVGISGALELSGDATSHCVLMPGGTIKCWGINQFGGLGDGTMTDRNSPVDVVGISGAVHVVAMNQDTCALFPGGTAKCWGANQYGNLGNGSTAYSSLIPVDVVGLSGITALSGTEHRLCALLAGGTVKCWGSNDRGGLGDGSTNDSLHPVTVLRPT